MQSTTPTTSLRAVRSLLLGLSVLSLISKPRVAEAVSLKESLQKSITYDYTPTVNSQACCLQNDIATYGGNVVLVNLDDNCDLDKLETYGLFIQTGDFIVVTGRSKPSAGQLWYVPYYSGLDMSIVTISQSFEDCVYGMPCKH